MIIVGVFGYIFDDVLLLIWQFEIVQDVDYLVILWCILSDVFDVQVGIYVVIEKFCYVMKGFVFVIVEWVESILQVGGKMWFICSMVVVLDFVDLF